MNRKFPKPYLWYPKNPKKYKGDVNNIWVRSSYEKKMFNWIDKNENVISWNSEEIIIPYISPIDGKMHRYYVDAYMQLRNAKGEIVEYLIEIKPLEQTKEPKVQKRMTKKYINEVYTWGINSSKWQAARAYCKKRNWQFMLITEKELFGFGE